MKKYIILLFVCLLLTGCNFSGKLDKKCTLETKGAISNIITYNIKFKHNKIYEIVKTTDFKSDDTLLLNQVMDSYKIEANNKTTDYVIYKVKDNTVTVTYDVKKLDLDAYQDIKSKYTDQKEYLENLGFTCE